MNVVFLITTFATIVVIAMASRSAPGWPAWKKLALGLVLLVVTRIVIFAINIVITLLMLEPYGLDTPNINAIMGVQLLADFVILFFLWLAFGWIYHRIGGREKDKNE